MRADRRLYRADMGWHLVRGGQEPSSFTTPSWRARRGHADTTEEILCTSFSRSGPSASWHYYVFSVRVISLDVAGHIPGVRGVIRKSTTYRYTGYYHASFFLAIGRIPLLSRLRSCFFKLFFGSRETWVYPTGGWIHARSSG